MDILFVAFMLAAASGCIVLTARTYTPADFDHLTVDRGRIEPSTPLDVLGRRSQQ